MKDLKEQKTELSENTLDHIRHRTYPISVILFYIERNGYITYDYDILCDPENVKNYSEWENEICNKFKELTFMSNDAYFEYVGFICCNFENISDIIRSVNSNDGYTGDKNLLKTFK